MNIRHLIGSVIGLTVVDITQHDADDFAEDGCSYVALHLSDGSTLKFFIGPDGFILQDPPDEPGLAWAPRLDFGRAIVV